MLKKLKINQFWKVLVFNRPFAQFLHVQTGINQQDMQYQKGHQILIAHCRRVWGRCNWLGVSCTPLTLPLHLHHSLYFFLDAYQILIQFLWISNGRYGDDDQSTIHTPTQSKPSFKSTIRPWYPNMHKMSKICKQHYRIF